MDVAPPSGLDTQSATTVFTDPFGDLFADSFADPGGDGWPTPASCPGGVQE